MFHSIASSSEASVAAADQVKAWEKALSLRISLQKSLDLANRLPLFCASSDDSGDEKSEEESESEAESGMEISKQLATLQETCMGLVRGLHEVLDIQVDSSDTLTSAKKGKKRRTRDDDDEIMWSTIEDTQRNLRPRWEAVVNKWHSRLHFGTEGNAKMKSFKQTLWDQISSTLEDDARIVEKTRLPWELSMRIGKEQSQGESKVIRDEKSFDGEVYDDRLFYSMLLKTFITQSASSGEQSMSAEDLKALRKFKKSNSNVDRKASKGRRVRYTVHPKLESFMFPVESESTGLDSDKLFQSLFQ